ncbi:hypothetical protein ACM5Q9_07805, partial [Advenella sp. RU8]|uniref:hypothetical protein n=1 Tax=Advenella sp. RU8 TaxID=3399575 RepID=UPI003AB06D55
LMFGAHLYYSPIGFLILATNLIILFHLQPLTPLLWICFIVSVFKRSSHHRIRKNNNEEVTPMYFIIRKFVKHWGIWFFILTSPPVLNWIYISNLNIPNMGDFTKPIIMDFLKSLVLSIPLGYFSMIYFKDSWDVSNKKIS